MPGDDILVSVILPLEICELIISSQDFGSAACCRVCKAWFPKARYDLYTTAFVYVHKISTFSRCLDISRTNAAFVKHLYVRGHEAHDENDHELSLLPVLLPDRLPNLTELTLNAIYFHDINPSFHTFMRRFYTITSMTWDSVKFSTAYQLARLARSIPHLKRLKVVRPSMLSTISERMIQTLHGSICISHLDLLHDASHPGKYPGRFMEMFSPEQLTEVSVLYNEFMNMKQCTKSLRHLHLVFVGGGDGEFLHCPQIQCVIHEHCDRPIP